LRFRPARTTATATSDSAPPAKTATATSAAKTATATSDSEPRKKRVRISETATTNPYVHVKTPMHFSPAMIRYFEHLRDPHDAIKTAEINRKVIEVVTYALKFPTSPVANLMFELNGDKDQEQLWTMAFKNN
jgi:hypothetical protein